MKKLLVGVALPVLLSAAINVYARQLTVDEATALAEGFVLNNLVKNDGSRSSIARAFRLPDQHRAVFILIT